MSEMQSDPKPQPNRRRARAKRAELPGISMILLVILLVTAPLTALLYLGRQLLRLPFVPFDLYDWPVRAGFAPWVRLVSALNAGRTAEGGNIAQAAPATQWVLGVGLFLVCAVILGLLLYVLARRRGRMPHAVDGIAAGAFFAALMSFVSLSVGSSQLPGWLVVAWLAALFIVWGAGLAFALRRLALARGGRGQTDGSREAPADPDSPAAQPVPAPEHGIDRRQFLLQFGASTAAITAVSAVAGAALAQRDNSAALQSTLPMISPQLREAERELFGGFRRFAIVRAGESAAGESSVVALGAEYPDRNYVSIWLGGRSPIVIYENLETALAAYSTDELPAAPYWLDGS